MNEFRNNRSAAPQWSGLRDNLNFGFHSEAHGLEAEPQLGRAEPERALRFIAPAHEQLTLVTNDDSHGFPLVWG